MVNLLEDLSVLTNVTKNTWDSMTDRSTSLLSHYILEAVQNSESDISVDIGIGILDIHIEEDEAQFRFTPSSKATQKICKTIKTRKSALVQDVDTALGDRFSTTYKELV